MLSVNNFAQKIELFAKKYKKVFIFCVFNLKMLKKRVKIVNNLIF